MISKTVISILVLGLSAYTQCYAQQDIVFSPYSFEFVSKSYQENSISATSRTYDGLERIPKSIVYMVIFREIQDQLFHEVNFSAKDRQIIQSLPSHNIAKFAAPDLMRQTSLCQSWDVTKKDGSTENIQSTAVAYEENRLKREDELTKHYEEIISSLSNEGKARVLDKLEALVGTDKLTFSTIDLVGLSAAVPNLGRQILDTSCDQLMIRAQKLPPERELLSQETNAYTRKVSAFAQNN